MEDRKNVLDVAIEARKCESVDSTSRPHKRYFLSVRQVADRWNMSERTVWRFLKSRQLPAYRFGSARRILEADVKQFEDERLMKTG